ncbi:MAG: bacteriohemerythrin [Defluviitaleaceae bacterium]|nr:bacteriohemerythrin [Defluviitaleaceae bacterium]
MLTITKDLETGVAKVDEQHRELVNQLNSMMTSQGSTRDENEKTLQFLTEYALMHFKTEEDLMEECKYPALLIHQGQHRLFVEKYLVFKENFEKDPDANSVSVDMLDFLKSWLLNHIKVSDVAFGKFYAEQ